MVLFDLATSTPRPGRDRPTFPALRGVSGARTHRCGTRPDHRAAHRPTRDTRTATASSGVLGDWFSRPCRSTSVGLQREEHVGGLGEVFDPGVGIGRLREGEHDELRRADVDEPADQIGEALP